MEACFRRLPQYCHDSNSATAKTTLGLERRNAMLWSYRIKEVDFGRAIDDIEKQLDEMGQVGWEAFATFPEPTDHARGRFLMLFKQPRTDRSSTRNQSTGDSAWDSSNPTK
jgi:hypothetical protein